jgi:hypothetical protein
MSKSVYAVALQKEGEIMYNLFKMLSRRPFSIKYKSGRKMYCSSKKPWIAQAARGASKYLLLSILLSFTSVSLMKADTLEIRVSDNNDDAEEEISDGSMYRDSSDLELVFDGSTQHAVGIRFRNITIPQNATIDSAYIQFTVDETDSGNTHVKIYGEDTDNAAQYSDSDYDITNRPKTSGSVTWNIPEWDNVGDSGADQRTPDLTSIVQEIVNRGGWSSGNSMAFIIEAGPGCNSSSCQNRRII